MKEISFKDLRINPFSCFGEDWMALTSGNQTDGYNAMTVAWGHLGSIWERGNHRNCLPTATCFVRPSRYTKTFMDKESYFSLSHFDASRKKALAYLGSHSGRDEDKTKAAGFTPVFEAGTTYLNGADMVLICRKLYHAPLLESGFEDCELVEFNYPQRDFHEMYIGEIVKVLVKE